MSQKFKKIQNKNDESTAYGKWFATAVYDLHFIETEQLADFIQTQASVKKSDIKAVLDASSRSASPASERPKRRTAAHRPSPPAVYSSSPRRNEWSSARR